MEGRKTELDEDTHEPSEVRPSHLPKSRGLENHEIQNLHGERKVWEC